jgi:hypothetical protein
MREVIIVSFLPCPVSERTPEPVRGDTTNAAAITRVARHLEGFYRGPTVPADGGSK